MLLRDSFGKLLTVEINWLSNSKNPFSQYAPLKLAKILAVLIKKRDRNCGLTLPKGKIVRKRIRSFKNNLIQFRRKMPSLKILDINNAFTDIATKHKMILICKKNLQNYLLIYMISIYFSTCTEKKNKIKIT